MIQSHSVARSEIIQNMAERTNSKSATIWSFALQIDSGYSILTTIEKVIPLRLIKGDKRLKGGELLFYNVKLVFSAAPGLLRNSLSTAS